jgi:hypothetical protein
MDWAANPERVEITEPRVAHGALPWVCGGSGVSTLKGLNPRLHRIMHAPARQSLVWD